MIVSFYTLGCKLNQLETEALASSFRRQGFLIVNGKQRADLYILNSCTVTSRSDQKGRKWVRSALRLNPEGIVIVTGCYAELDPDVLASLSNNVLVVNQEDKALLLKLPSLLKEFLNVENFSFFSAGEKRRLIEGIIKKLREEEQFTNSSERRFLYTLNHFNFHSRAFLKIQDGCDYRCSYCRVPLARGGSISLDYRIIVERIKLLASMGYNEIVLTGVNIASYRYEDCDFPALLEKILKSGVHSRIRLSSIEPERIDSRFGDIVSDNRVCPHFHIPVQSFSDNVLRLMRRRYNSSVFENVFKILRNSKHDPFVALDIIVGFPGESEEDFSKTYSLIERYKPAKVHVFPFSPRPGTEAFYYRNRVPERIRDERVRRVIELSEHLEEEYAKRWVGREVEIVVENVKENRIMGVSENYLKIAVPIDGKKISSGNNSNTLAPNTNINRYYSPGSLVRVKIVQAGKLCSGVPV